MSLFSLYRPAPLWGSISKKFSYVFFIKNLAGGPRVESPRHKHHSGSCLKKWHLFKYRDHTTHVASPTIAQVIQLPHSILSRWQGLDRPTTVVVDRTELWHSRHLVAPGTALITPEPDGMRQLDGRDPQSFDHSAQELPNDRPQLLVFDHSRPMHDPC